MKNITLALLLATPLLVGCPADDPEPSGVRVIHLSPDAPAVDVFVNEADTPAVTNLAYGEGTDYLDVPSGLTTLHIAPAGGTIDEAVLVVRNVDLEPEARYSAVAYDVLDEIKALALLDDDLDIDANETRLQISHTAAGVGAVDIWDLAGPTRIVDDLGFGQTAMLDVPAGPLTLGLDVDGDATPDYTFEVPNLGGGAFVNVYAVLDDQGAHLIAHLPEGGTARLDPTQIED